MSANAVLLLIAIPRIALFLITLFHPVRIPENGDSDIYLQLASVLAHHHRFALPSGDHWIPQTFRTPLYPLFLSLFAWSQQPVVWISLAQLVLSGWAAYAVWQRLAVDRPTGAWVAAFFLSWDIVTLLHTPLVMTESLFNTVTVFMILLFWPTASQGPDQKPLLKGFTWAILALIKPVALYLPPVLALVCFRAWRARLLFLMLAFSLPALWTWRNHHVAGFNGLASVGGISLLRYPAAGIEALRTGKSWSQADTDLRQEVTRAHEGLTDPIVMDRAYSRHAAKILMKHPILLTEFCTIGAIRILGGTGLEMLIDAFELRIPTENLLSASLTQTGTRRLLKAFPWLRPIHVVYILFLLTLYGLYAFGIWRLLQQGQTAWALFLLICPLYYCAMAAHQGYYRFRIPMMPYLAIGAAFVWPKRRGV